MNTCVGNLRDTIYKCNWLVMVFVFLCVVITTKADGILVVGISVDVGASVLVVGAIVLVDFFIKM
jgi:hypothetical protein